MSALVQRVALAVVAVCSWWELADCACSGRLFWQVVLVGVATCSSSVLAVDLVRYVRGD